jgi:hypothetical protein
VIVQMILQDQVYNSDSTLVGEVEVVTCNREPVSTPPKY